MHAYLVIQISLMARRVYQISPSPFLFETLFLPPLPLPLLLLAKKAVSSYESKVPRPNVSPGHFLYFPVFLPRRLLLGKLQRGTRDTGLGGFISPRVSPFLPTFTGTRADFSIRSKDRKEGREGEARDEFEWERDRERESSVSRIL